MLFVSRCLTDEDLIVLIYNAELTYFLPSAAICAAAAGSTGALSFVIKPAVSARNTLIREIYQLQGQKGDVGKLWSNCLKIRQRGMPLPANSRYIK